MDIHADFVLAEELIKAGLLQEIRGDRLKERAPTGAILITCGDRDRFKHHFTGCNGFVDVHPLCLNGGGVLLSDGVDADRQRVLTQDTEEACIIKGLHFALSLSHFPCGKCTALGIGFREAVLRTLEGKVHLKKYVPRTMLKGVLPLMSIDWRSAHIKQEHGVKLYALRLQDYVAIADFGCAYPDDYVRLQPHSGHRFPGQRTSCASF